MQILQYERSNSSLWLLNTNEKHHLLLEANLPIKDLIISKILAGVTLPDTSWFNSVISLA